MTIPLYLAVAQWALLLALGLLVFVMYRQLGRILNATGNASATGELGPVVGTRAAGFEYTRVSDDTRQYFTPGGGQPSLVAFVDPTCPACEQLVSSLNAAADSGELAELRVLLLTSDPPAYLQISDTFRTTRLEIGRPVSRAAHDDYKASATPLLVGIDVHGEVRAAGSVRRPGEVRGFVSKANVPTPRDPSPIALSAPGSSVNNETHVVTTPSPGE
jgi:hypothetical protein